MRIPFRGLIQGTVVACLVASGPAQAADIDRSTPLGRLVDRFIGLVLPPSPTEALNAVSPDAGIFWSLIADCGYRVAEVVTEAGIPPRVTVRLERTLELAEEDRTWIGRRLDDWAADDDGISAMLSRRVVIALLEASEDPRFEAVGVDITLTPVPSASFRLAPHAAGFPIPGDRLVHEP
jgi:hypothetical protein